MATQNTDLKEAKKDAIISPICIGACSFASLRASARSRTTR